MYCFTASSIHCSAFCLVVASRTRTQTFVHEIVDLAFVSFTIRSWPALLPDQCALLDQPPKSLLHLGARHRLVFDRAMFLVLLHLHNLDLHTLDLGVTNLCFGLWMRSLASSCACSVSLVSFKVWRSMHSCTALLYMASMCYFSMLSLDRPTSQGRIAMKKSMRSVPCHLVGRGESASSCTAVKPKFSRRFVAVHLGVSLKSPPRAFCSQGSSARLPSVRASHKNPLVPVVVRIRSRKSSLGLQPQAPARLPLSSHLEPVV